MTDLHNIVLLNVLILILIAYYYKPEKPKSKPVIPLKARPLEELLSELNSMIELELMFHLKIETEIKKSTKVITNFANELKAISKKISNALSETFVDELSYYYNEAYIGRYIIKTVEIYMIKYMNDNKITTK